jgi:hypothetical protein
MRVPGESVEPMRMTDIHAEVERELRQPVSKSAVKDWLASHVDEGDNALYVRLGPIPTGIDPRQDRFRVAPPPRRGLTARIEPSSSRRFGTRRLRLPGAIAPTRDELLV